MEFSDTSLIGPALAQRLRVFPVPLGADSGGGGGNEGNSGDGEEKEAIGRTAWDELGNPANLNL